MDFDETFLKNTFDQMTLPQMEALLLSRKLHQEFGTDLIALLENAEKTETLFCEKIIELIQDEPSIFKSN